MNTYINEKEFLNNLFFKKQSSSFFNQNIDFDKIVHFSSSHLMLPSMYSKLKEKNQLKYIPQELEKYLSKIYKMNHKRNMSLVNEIKEISSLFREKKINHVFIKGSANIISGLYTNIGDRMVGDIDILVHKNDLEQAYKILNLEGYFKLKNSFITTRHLHRIINKNKLFAIELHKSLFDNEKVLKTKEILEKKVYVNEVYIPCETDRFYNNIYNYQINDEGYAKLSYSYKCIYDYFLLKNKYKIKIRNLKFDKYLSSFLMITNNLNISNYDNNVIKLNRSNDIRYRLMKISKLFRIFNRLVTIESKKIKIRFKQIKEFMINKDYRRYILKKKI